MEIEPTKIAGAFAVLPRQHPDDRGMFLEWLRDDELRRLTGHGLQLAQANLSVSSRGTVRGIHFAEVPPGQAKYVTCVSGAALDVVVDLRTGSPTYGQWDSVLLDDTDRRAVYLGEGLGHAFMALADHTVVTYLCSAPYNPAREHGINPYDPAIDIVWPTTGADGEEITPILSPRDGGAPSLAEAEASGILAGFDEVQRFVDGLA